MKKPIIIKILSILIHIAICLISTIIILYFQDWFGSGDIYSLLIWTFSLATGVAVSGQTILSLIRTQNLLFRLLLIILSAVFFSFVFVCLVYFFIGPWFNAFSVPVFYLWIAGAIVQLFFLDRFLPKTTKKLRPSKIIIAIVAFPLTVLLTAMSNFAIDLLISSIQGQEYTYLIPDDFEGEVRVVYGEECGINPPKEDGRIVLEIPDNGLLIIQSETTSGFIDHEYYFIDPKGRREKIESLSEDQKDLKGVWYKGTGGFGGEMPDGSSSTLSPLAIHFYSLYVYDGNSKLSDEEYELQRRQMNSLTRSLVKKCRGELKDKANIYP